MQIILVKLRDIFPCASAEYAGPVGRLPAILAFSEDIVIMIGAVFILKGSPEPGMLIGGMIADEIHHEFHATLMYASYHLVKILHGTEFGSYGPVIRHIISSVSPWAYEEGT